MPESKAAPEAVVASPPAAPAAEANAPVPDRRTVSAPSVPAASNEPGAQRGAGRWPRTIGWISLAVGGESAIVAGVTSFMLLHQKAVRDRECDAARRCTPVGLDANGTIRSLADWNTATWIGAVAGVGAGITLVLTHPVHRAPTAGLTISPAPGGATLAVGSAF